MILQTQTSEHLIDGLRLPFTDKGTRVVIFGDSIDQARAVAVEVAQNAYWNSSYFGGTYDDIRRAHLW
jgi:hypothetical protein